MSSHSLDDARLAAQVAEEAGRLLLAVRAGGLVGQRLGDAGDFESNRLIQDRLGECRPDDMILSEESPDDLRRLEADRVWIVDPLDGTREYRTPGRQDWAVHIALWERDVGIAVAAVSLPAQGKVFASDRVPDARSAHDGPRRLAVSDSRPQPVASAVAAAAGFDVVRMGSAGAKAMAVVEGTVDAYVHTGGQWEWDSAAPVGVAMSAGLHASRVDGSTLVYNRATPYVDDLLICRAEQAALLLGLLRGEVASRRDEAHRLGSSE